MNPTQYVIQLSEAPITDFGRKAFSEQTDPQKVFTAVFGSSGAIMMDGLLGYFSNSDGESAQFVAEAYQIIGSPRRAYILTRACSIVSSDPIPEDDEHREELLSGISEEQIEQLEALSDEFMMLEEEIDPLLLDYIRASPETFGAIPESVE